MKYGALKNSEMSSLISQLAQLKPKRKAKFGLIAASLMLTSLVDVFSILVIYLLVNTSASKEIIKVDQPIKLPHATQASLIDSGVNIQIVGNKYFINHKLVGFENILSELKKLNSSLKNSNAVSFNKIIIQADKSAPFEKINPILLMSAEAGFENIKFATIKLGS